jgi:hypothetical protein
VTPVAVSLWVTKTALISPLRVGAEAALEFLARHARAPGHVDHLDVEAERSAISTQSVENWPKRAISTLSPGFSVLVIAASHAPVPEPGKMKTSPVACA